MTDQIRFAGWLAPACAVLMATGSGCQPRNELQQPAPPPVTVTQPVQKTVTIYLEETGTTEAVERVELRARVKGFLERVDLKPGKDVAQGKLLYVIQPRQFKAKVDAAKAELAAQEVALKKAEIESDRQKRLLEGNATSETAVVAAEAERDGAKAAVAEAKALLDQAELDLEYTQVKAPISGRVGKTLVKVGNLVGDGEATHLTTVIKYDPIYANFNISERALLEILATAPKGEDDRPKTEAVRLELKRATDTNYPFKGHVDYADLAVDQSTGTFLVRGIFPNPDREILPGLFVSIRLPLGEKQGALLVPERAVGADQAGKYVMIVNEQNDVERRDVTVGRKSDGMIVVDTGLQAGDWVIIEGIQRARPGAKVTPKRVERPTDAANTEAHRQGQETPAGSDRAEAEQKDTAPAGNSSAKDN